MMDKIELSRLQRFYDKNPKLKCALEKDFPELVQPEVFVGDLFIESYLKIVYERIKRV